MKKLTSVMLGVIMLLAVSLQAFAAPSIVGSIDRGHISFSTGSGTWADFVRENYPADLQALVDRVNSAGVGVSVQDSFGDDASALSGIKVYDINSRYFEDGSYLPPKMYYLSPMLELTFDGVTPTEENTVEVTFTVTTLNDSMEVYVLYYCPEHGCWELLKTERTGDNQVTACFHSGTSLVSLVYIDKGVSADTAEGTSPKTGETHTTEAAAVAALALMVLGVYAVKRSKKAA